MVKALLCEEVEVRKLEVTFISKLLRFYGVEALSFEGSTLRERGSTVWRLISLKSSEVKF